MPIRAQSARLSTTSVTHVTPAKSTSPALGPPGFSVIGQAPGQAARLGHLQALSLTQLVSLDGTLLGRVCHRGIPEAENVLETHIGLLREHLKVYRRQQPQYIATVRNGLSRPAAVTQRIRGRSLRRYWPRSYQRRDANRERRPLCVTNCTISGAHMSHAFNV